MNHAFKEHIRRGFTPLVTLLTWARIHPNVLTVLGLALATIAGVRAGAGHVREGALWLLASGILDMTDGPVARRMGKSGRAGAFLDSTLDRYSEGAFFAGLAWHFAGRGESTSAVLAIVLVVLGSFQISYARARAEGLGLECRVGLMERPERLVVTIAACLIGGSTLVPLLWALAVLVHATALHRMLHVYGKLRS
jgi:CDP-diacylglycerol--glycerol-3-phosphate 3-phosphatidyltransferase